MAEYGYENSELGCSSHYLLPVIREALKNISAGSVVLDLGCGNGSMLAQFRGRGWELHGLDMSESGLAEARKAYADIDFGSSDLTSDLSSHPLIGKCDVVIGAEVIEHVFLPRLFAKNCYAFLRPGGMLIVSTPYHGYLEIFVLWTAIAEPLIKREFTM